MITLRSNLTRYGIKRNGSKLEQRRHPEYLKKDIGSTCLYVPAGYAGMSRWRHIMSAVLSRAGFWFVCRPFSPARCHFQHWSLVPGALLRRKIIYTSRSSGQMHSELDRDHFLLITRYCFTLCKEGISPNSYLCIYSKNCRQANCDNRHIVPNVPTGLDRDIRDMPIACARTHPDANKHTRHIPMYRPVHSAHANKCSHSGSRLSVKMSSYQYRDPHVKDKTVPRPSYL